MLVAIDSNIIDLVERAVAATEHAEAREAREPPPGFPRAKATEEQEVWACYWLVAMGSAWSTIYTYSDALHREAADAPASRAYELLLTAGDVFSRSLQPADLRDPNPALAPALDELRTIGLSSKDAQHVADAIGLGCSVLLTNDRRLRNKSDAIEVQWGMTIRRPTEFLIETVRSGAPWPRDVPWPWERLQREGEKQADTKE